LLHQSAIEKFFIDGIRQSMTRQQRTISSTGIYHVLIRGVNMQRIFEDDEDCLTFLAHLGVACNLSNAPLLAFCLMGNHVHLVIEQGDEPLGVTMKRLSVRYVSWFNLRYGRSGHLFQDRFKSEAVETDAYFVTVLRYVYGNPVKAGLCSCAQDYRWSSCRLFGSKNDLINAARLSDLCDIDELLSFGPEDKQGDILDVGDPPRRRKTDAEIAETMRSVGNASSASAFQVLGRDQQVQAVGAMLDDGASIRQIARMTGLSKGLVESRARSARAILEKQEGTS
jgi:REP element-mobilizing transposase RayT